jgi:hypothetical protein
LVNEPSLPITIPGEIFIIPYKNCINLNLHFIILPDDIKEIEGMLNTSEPADKPIE